LESPKKAPKYTFDGEKRPETYINEFHAPPEMQGLTGTSMILEIDKKKIYPGDLCVYCLNDFTYYDEKVYKCKECGSFYHENCLNVQLDTGVCKKCDKLLLW